MADLGGYNFVVNYKPEKLNCDADALSRRPIEVHCSSVNALLNQGDFTAECLTINDDQSGETTGLPTVSLDVKWSEEQLKDPVLNEVIQLVKTGKKPTKEERSQLSPEVLHFLNEWSRLSVHEDVIYRKECKPKLMTEDRYFDIFVGPKWPKTQAYEAHIHTPKVAPLTM